MSISGGLDAWRGFYSSVRPAHKTLMVNVNVCTTAFYTPGNLADGMYAFARASHGARFGAFLKGVRVRTKHLGSTKTIKGVHASTPQAFSFQAEGMGTVTVEQYFKKSESSVLPHSKPFVDHFH